MATKKEQKGGFIKGAKGSTTDLMPSVMGALDALFLDSSHNETPTSNLNNVNGGKRQANQFARLSRNVQKILANVPDEELSKNFNGDETFLKRFHDVRRTTTKHQLQRNSPEKNLNRSNESLDIISPNVQKILSNLPDAELVITSDNSNISTFNKNNSFLHKNVTTRFHNNVRNEDDEDEDECEFGRSVGSMKVSKSTSSITINSNNGNGYCNNRNSCHMIRGSNSGGYGDDVIEREEDEGGGESAERDAPQPLGSYLHRSPSGIASRTPAGRKNMGKFLQVPSESSVGTNSTASSEVSRPVSLTSLGSCSSSSSGGGHNQPGSAYLASAESLDSDPEPSGSQGSADSGIAEQPTMSPELCVLHEVMDTENIYVADLREVIEGYLKPWREDPTCPLSEHLQDLFSNLEEIYRFNREFLEQLKEANLEPTKIANCFIQNDSGFSIYTEYCTHYPRTMDVLGVLTRDENVSGFFREKQMKLGHALPLGSYLLKPVQRILKYHLLLQRLSKQCSAPHKPAVDLALATMTSVATHINTMKRKHEHAVRVQEIQSQLYGWTGSDLTALGELIAEGTFRVGGARGRRHAFLFDKVLLLAKTKPDGYLAYKMHIMCSNLMLVEQVRGEPLSFHVLPFDNPRRQCTLRARSALQKREWTLQLKRAILENYNAAIPSHARQLVMQLGQDTTEDATDDNKSRSTPLKQHSAPQYLERRSRFRKSRDSSGRRAASSERSSFPTLPNWRRKSEPGIIQQYTTKTLPKRISKLKKVKDSTAKFYTDFSDSENIDMGESMESLNRTEEDGKDESGSVVVLEDIDETEMATNTLEKVVSDLLMQNEEFQRVLNKKDEGSGGRNGGGRRMTGGRDSESSEKTPQMPSKADSLPRDFQLNQQENDNSFVKKDGQKLAGGLSFKIKPDSKLEENQEKTILSSLDHDDNKHPEHKIYRKSMIRSSLVQRFRAMLHEEQKQKNKEKIPTSYKQGSESMGAKIANPDYIEPLRLFSSFSSSSTSSKTLLTDRSSEATPENNKNGYKSYLGSSKSADNLTMNSVARKITSQNFENYYESVMEQRLSEEYVIKIRNVTTEEGGKMVKVNYEDNPDSSTLPSKERRSVGNIKRPTKAPPPVPSKPARFLNTNSAQSKEVARSRSEPVSLKSEIASKGWVKTVVGRFE